MGTLSRNELDKTKRCPKCESQVDSDGYVKVYGDDKGVKLLAHYWSLSDKYHATLRVGHYTVAMCDLHKIEFGRNKNG